MNCECGTGLEQPQTYGTTYDLSLLGPQISTLVFNHNMQSWTVGDLECIDYSDRGNNLVHSLFPVWDQNDLPGPNNPSSHDLCPNSCNAAGTCDCGVCTCFDPLDLSYDCGISGGGG